MWQLTTSWPEQQRLGLRESIRHRREVCGMHGITSPVATIMAQEARTSVHPVQLAGCVILEGQRQKAGEMQSNMLDDGVLLA